MTNGVNPGMHKPPYGARTPSSPSTLFLVLHLMIAGRLRWLKPAAKPPGKITQAVFEFDSGQLAFTEGRRRPQLRRPVQVQQRGRRLYAGEVLVLALGASGSGPPCTRCRSS